MGLLAYNTILVTSKSDLQGVQSVDHYAKQLGLATSGVIQLPINGDHWLTIYPVGSKTHWLEDDHNINAVHAIIDFVEKHNVNMEGTFLKAVFLRIEETDHDDGRPIANIIRESLDFSEDTMSLMERMPKAPAIPEKGERTYIPYKETEEYLNKKEKFILDYHIAARHSGRDGENATLHRKKFIEAAGALFDETMDAIYAKSE